MPQKPTRLFDWIAMILDYIGIGCFIVGIIGAAADIMIAFMPTYWFLIALGLWLFTIRAPILALVEAKKEK